MPSTHRINLLTFLKRKRRRKFVANLLKLSFSPWCHCTINPIMSVLYVLMVLFALILGSSASAGSTFTTSGTVAPELPIDPRHACDSQLECSHSSFSSSNNECNSDTGGRLIAEYSSQIVNNGIFFNHIYIFGLYCFNSLIKIILPFPRIYHIF